jgi:hypothetical protein
MSATDPGNKIVKIDSGEISIPRHEYEVCRALVVFNQLRTFKLDKVEVLQWKDTIMRVKPGVNLDELKLAIDGLVSGEIPYDQAIGIKNIFIALRRITRDDDGKLVILKPPY